MRTIVLLCALVALSGCSKKSAAKKTTAAPAAAPVKSDAPKTADDGDRALCNSLKFQAQMANTPGLERLGHATYPGELLRACERLSSTGTSSETLRRHSSACVGWGSGIPIPVSDLGRCTARVAGE